MKKILLLTLLILLCLPFLTQAAGLVPCGGEGEPACTFCHLFVLFNNIVEFVMFKIVPSIAVLILIVGGIMLFFAGARPQLLSQAKSAITAVVIGLVIIFSAWIIVNTILVHSGLVSSERGSALFEWWKIACEIPMTEVDWDKNPNQFSVPKGESLFLQGVAPQDTPGSEGQIPPPQK